MTAVEEIRERLLQNADEGFKKFNSSLVPTVGASTVIGVRTPVLRRLASELYGTEAAEVFMQSLPHKYLEENHLHAYLTEKIKDFDRCVAAVEEFLPFIDNWATCDTMSPTVFGHNTDRLLPRIESWLGSRHTYTVRFGTVMLLRYYLDENFKPEILTLAESVPTDEYYLSTAVAWFFATALAKQYESAVKVLEQRRLDRATHLRTVQKAVESFRVEASHKEYLKTLKY